MAQTLPTLRADYALDGDTLSSVIKESEREHLHNRPRPLAVTPPPHQSHDAATAARGNDWCRRRGANAVEYECSAGHARLSRPHALARGVPAKPPSRGGPAAESGRGGAEQTGLARLHPLTLRHAQQVTLEVVEMLLESKRTLADCTDVRGRTPLLTAAHCNQQHVLSALVTRHLSRLSPLHTDVEGRNVLHYLTNVSDDAMKQLVRKVKELKDKVGILLCAPCELSVFTL